MVSNISLTSWNNKIQEFNSLFQVVTIFYSHKIKLYNIRSVDNNTDTFCLYNGHTNCQLSQIARRKCTNINTDVYYFSEVFVKRLFTYLVYVLE